MSIFDLELRTNDVTLRIPNEDETQIFAGLVVEEGVMEEGTNPFGEPWADETGRARAEAFADMVDKARTTLTRGGSFVLPLLAVETNTQKPMGLFKLDGTRFAADASFEEISYVLKLSQGKGATSQVAVAVKELMFQLGARAARTDVFDDNPRAMKVAERLGYRHVGTHTSENTGKLTHEYEVGVGEFARFAARIPGVDVDVRGLDEFKAALPATSSLLTPGSGAEISQSPVERTVER